MRSEHLLKFMQECLGHVDNSRFATYMLDHISSASSARKERIKLLLLQIPGDYRRIEDLRKFLEEYHVQTR